LLALRIKLKFSQFPAAVQVQVQSAAVAGPVVLDKYQT
jgi:hypothetical protein